MTYDAMHMGRGTVPGSPYYVYEYECSCGWEYNQDDAEAENGVCPKCEIELEFKPKD